MVNSRAADDGTILAGVKRLAMLGVFGAVMVAFAPHGFASAPPDEGSSGDTVLAGATDTVAESVPEVLEPESGSPTPAPALVPSAPLRQTPPGCPSPPLALVVFVGTLVAKDRITGRYQVDQIRAGNADSYIVTDLIDIRYEDETQYLTVDDQYLIGAAQSETGFGLSSKVRATDLLFGGNAVIGLTEENRGCPPIEDPVRTLHVDGSDVPTSVFTGVADAKHQIALAFLKPLAVAFAIIVALVLVRWLFAAIFVAVRNAADGEPVTSLGRHSRRHVPDS